MRIDKDSDWISPPGTPALAHPQQEYYDPLSLSLKAIGCGLWDYDIDADVLTCDDRWHEIMEIDLDLTRVCKMGDFLTYIHPDDIDLVSKIDPVGVKSLLANDEIYHIEFRIVRPSKEIRCIRSVACIIQDPVSRHLRAVGSITDITEFRTVALKGRMSILLSHWKTANTPDETLRWEQKYGVRAHEKMDIGPCALSERQRECLLWVSMGKTAWETAQILEKSPRTVEFHLRNAIKKLGASNKIHAAAIAIRLGLL
jgi:DNA-binding CsgD family transcriptional regulator